MVEGIAARCEPRLLGIDPSTVATGQRQLVAHDVEVDRGHVDVPVGRPGGPVQVAVDV